MNNYWKEFIKSGKVWALVILLLLMSIVLVYGEDKVGQGDVVDLTESKPKEGIVFAVCIFAVGEDGMY